MRRDERQGRGRQGQSGENILESDQLELESLAESFLFSKSIFPSLRCARTRQVCGKGFRRQGQVPPHVACQTAGTKMLFLFLFQVEKLGGHMPRGRTAPNRPLVSTHSELGCRARNCGQEQSG